MSDSIKYNELKPIYQVQRKSYSLFNYLLANNVLTSISSPNELSGKLFYKMNKEDLIQAYKELSRMHLLLLENLDDEYFDCSKSITTSDSCQNI